MDALEGASVGDKSNIEIMKAFSRGFERGRQEMMDREFPEMRGASRTAGTEKVRGEAQVGDLVTYHDMANQRGEVWEVVEPPEGDSFTPSGIASQDGATSSGTWRPEPITGATFGRTAGPSLPTSTLVGTPLIARLLGGRPSWTPWS